MQMAYAKYIILEETRCFWPKYMISKLVNHYIFASLHEDSFYEILWLVMASLMVVESQV